MASQAKSGFSTEGTQYATDSSYYLLDTVPGAGSVIEGPVTVTNNLTVTGNETVQGALGVAGNITAPGLFAPSAAALTVSGVGSNFLSMLPTGDIRLITGTTAGTPADRITISNADVPGTLAQLNGLDINGGLVTLQAGAGGTGRLNLYNKGNGGLSLLNDCAGSSMLIQNATASASLSVLNTGTGNLNITNASTGSTDLNIVNTNPTGQIYVTNSAGNVYITSGSASNNFILIGPSAATGAGVTLSNGLSCTGSFAAPLAIGASYVMTTNKGFFSTNQAICIIFFPSYLGVGTGRQGIALISGIDGQAYSPLSATQDGVSLNLSFLPGGNNFFKIVVL